MQQGLVKAVKRVKSEHGGKANEIRHLLADERIDVNYRDQLGETALHAACGYNIRSDVGAQLLLNDERCDVNVQDDFGITALMTAVRLVESEDDKYAKIVRLLLAHPSIDVNKQNEEEETALHTACGFGTKSHIGAQLLLIDEKCDVNLKDRRHGNTALMTAVRWVESEDDKHAKIVRLLLVIRTSTSIK